MNRRRFLLFLLMQKFHALTPFLFLRPHPPNSLPNSGDEPYPINQQRAYQASCLSFALAHL